jgi:hypothetical protein
MKKPTWPPIRSVVSRSPETVHGVPGPVMGAPSLRGLRRGAARDPGEHPEEDETHRGNPAPWGGPHRWDMTRATSAFASGRRPSGTSSSTAGPATGRKVAAARSRSSRASRSRVW